MDAVEDPVNTLEKPNVMTPWLDLLTAAGAKVLLMHGRFFDKFSELAEDLKNGVDDFEMWQSRADGIVDHSARSWPRQSRAHRVSWEARATASPSSSRRLGTQG